MNDQEYESGKKKHESSSHGPPSSLRATIEEEQTEGQIAASSAFDSIFVRTVRCGLELAALDHGGADVSFDLVPGGFIAGVIARSVMQVHYYDVLDGRAGHSGLGDGRRNDAHVLAPAQ